VAPHYDNLVYRLSKQLLVVQFLAFSDYKPILNVKIEHWHRLVGDEHKIANLERNNYYTKLLQQQRQLLAM
jgi:hypothetical protein